MHKTLAAVSAALIFTGTAAQAEVVEADASGFVTRDEAVVEALPKEVWLALIDPAKWSGVGLRRRVQGGQGWRSCRQRITRFCFQRVWGLARCHRRCISGRSAWGW